MAFVLMFCRIDLNELKVMLRFRAVGLKISRVMGSNPENLLAQKNGMVLFLIFFFIEIVR
jgi:hypothetical protein